MPTGVQAQRPSQTSTVPGLFLAGDWTQTGWPATMESAVRSGAMAAAAVADILSPPGRGLGRFPYQLLDSSE